jgi:hypothetical protein
MSNLNIGPSIVLDASYQVSVHLAKQFQKQELPMVAMFVNGSVHFKIFVYCNQNMVGSIYGRSSIKIAHLVPIC